MGAFRRFSWRSHGSLSQRKTSRQSYQLVTLRAVGPYATNSHFRCFGGGASVPQWPLFYKNSSGYNIVGCLRCEWGRFLRWILFQRTGGKDMTDRRVYGQC